ncbi:MAG: signal peptide peptidase SppA [Candidatus Nanohaloarchaea archaeon]|nr:signal peptide peptidase SppA [Candidatus Nanohaloarchaea archaeon]
MLERLHWSHFLLGLFILASVAFLASPAAEELRTGLNPKRGELAVIQLNGPIRYGNGFRSEGVSPGMVSDLTEKAVGGGADAILYEINSGGGAVVASRQVAQVIEEAGVPTVCRMKEVAASGAYWAASACDRIVADPLTLTGSIGVSSTYLEFSGLLNRFGVEYVNLTSARYKDMGSQYKNLTQEERQRFNEILNTTHRYFVRSIAENRNLSVEQVEKAATGEVFLGREAKRLGLVDRLGGRQEAVDLAENLTNTTELETDTYSPPQRFDLLSYLFSSLGEGIARGLKGSVSSDTRRRLS